MLHSMHYNFIHSLSKSIGISGPITQEDLAMIVWIHYLGSVTCLYCFEIICFFKLTNLKVWTEFESWQKFLSQVSILAPGFQIPCWYKKLQMLLRLMKLLLFSHKQLFPVVVVVVMCFNPPTEGLASFSPFHDFWLIGMYNDNNAFWTKNYSWKLKMTPLFSM